MPLSDYLAPSLQIGSTILSAGSQVARGAAARTIGARRKAAAEFEAQQLEQEAETSQAIGMRRAADEGRKTQMVNSLALARAAASGAGASDPTVLHVLAQTSGEGAYRQWLAMYEGEAQARLDKMRAGATRFEGATAESDAAMAQRQYNLGAMNTVLTGGIKTASMYQRYFPRDRRIGGTDTYLDAGTPDTLDIS